MAVLPIGAPSAVSADGSAFTSAASATFSTNATNSFSVTTTEPTATISVTSGSLPGGVTLTDNGDGTATLAGSPGCSTTGTYSVTIEADWTLDSTPFSSTQDFTLTVQSPTTQPATFSGPTTDTVVANQPVTPFTVTSSCAPLPTLTATGVPMGMTFVDNHNGTGTIAGKPRATDGGIYTTRIRAQFVVGIKMYASIESLTITVNEPPQFGSPYMFTTNAGSTLSFTVKTKAYPVASIALTSGTLPPDVTLHDNGNGTATLAGPIPATAGGLYKVVLTATSTSGTMTQNLQITVWQAPAITSANSAADAVGQHMSFHFAATGYPKPVFTESGALPTGLTFMSGVLAGRPAVGTENTYPITITATNHNKGVAYTATQAFTLTIN